MKIYRIASKEYQYIGPCDRLRHNNPENNENWHQMIKSHSKVDIDEFKAMCNYEYLVEEGETLDEIISDDSLSYFAKSIWGDKDCYYMMTSGFEFIFVKV